MVLIFFWKAIFIAKSTEFTSKRTESMAAIMARSTEIIMGIIAKLTESIANSTEVIANGNYS